MPTHNMHPYSSAQTEEDQIPAQPPTSQQEESSQQPPVENQAPIEPAPSSAETEIDPAEKAKAEIEDMRLRMAAEMDNFKKRLTREHQEQMRYASEKVLSDLLPALDNLDLALQYGAAHEACREMMQGIEMTRRQLLDAVAKSGLIAVGEKGETFNPANHEAIGIETDPELEPGAVSKVLQRGYKLNDRLLRPAKVMVNNS